MDTKKVLHVKIPNLPDKKKHNELLQISMTLKKAFSDKYDMIFTPNEIDIHSDNMVVLTIDNSTDINMLAKKLNELTINKK